jgi:hypothetical protein
MKDTIGQLRGKLTTAEEVNAKALESLTLAVNQSSELLFSARLAQNQASAMVAERDGLIDEVRVKDSKIATLNAKYQRAQFIIAIVSAVAAFLFASQFTRALAPPYNLIAPFAAAAAVFGLVYAFL